MKDCGFVEPPLCMLFKSNIWSVTEHSDTEHNPAQSLQLGCFFVNLSGASAMNYRVVRQRCMERRLHVVEQEKLSVQTEAMMPFWVVLEIKST